MNNQFQKDIINGLSSTPKSLPSKYFYDKNGDALFVKIMHSEEYYITRSELEIFQEQTLNLIKALQLKNDAFFDLIELGAGDGFKTKKLLKSLVINKYNFRYLPIDISRNSLDQLEKSLSQELPTLNISTKQGDYFEILQKLEKKSNPKIILFLGSNIGNLDDNTATLFLTKLSSKLNQNDKLLLGVDLIKPASIVAPAYDDKLGYTKDFNLNLLKRINTELHADFDLNNFEHTPEYSEEEGIAKSFIMSIKNQTVLFKTLNKTFHFKKGEKIQTEISRKYSTDILNQIIKTTGFEIATMLTDQKNYFANYILNRV